MLQLILGVPTTATSFHSLRTLLRSKTGTHAPTSVVLVELAIFVSQHISILTTVRLRAECPLTIRYRERTETMYGTQKQRVLKQSFFATIESCPFWYYAEEAVNDHGRFVREHTRINEGTAPPFSLDFRKLQLS